MDPIRVLIADDEALVRHALRIFVTQGVDMDVIGEAVDGIEAVQYVESLRPDVVLMDLQMPRMGGIEATRQISIDHPHVRVIAVTTFSSERHILPALRAGASGYLVKDTEPAAILTAIRDVHGGQSIISPQITKKLLESLRSSPELPSDLRSIPEALTGRELSIIQLLARGKSNAEIAKDLHLAEPTVKSNLARAMQKWGTRDRVQTLIYAVTNHIVELK